MSISHPRGTSNSNDRGNHTSRRRRRIWLICAWGDGTRVPCAFCGVQLDVDTVTVDRIIPGILEGRYDRGNIRPSCLSCNSIEGNRLRWLLGIGADFFGRSFPDTGIHHVHRRARLSVGQTATIQYLLADGRLSQARIAREVGCSVDSVRRTERTSR